MSENETADFCVIVWGPLSQPLHVLVETTDSGAALGESLSGKKKRSSMIYNFQLTLTIVHCDKLLRLSRPSH